MAQPQLETKFCRSEFLHYFSCLLIFCAFNRTRAYRAVKHACSILKNKIFFFHKTEILKIIFDTHMLYSNNGNFRLFNPKQSYETISGQLK